MNMKIGNMTIKTENLTLLLVVLVLVAQVYLVYTVMQAKKDADMLMQQVKGAPQDLTNYIISHAASIVKALEGGNN